MKQTHKVIMRPTPFQETAPFFKDSITVGKLISNSSYFNPPKSDSVVSYINFTDCEYNHLYVLSSDKPAENDWVHEENLSDEHLYQVCKRNGKLGIFRFQNVFVPLDKTSCQKIVATTNRALKIHSLLKVHTLPESFIQAFIAAYNTGKPITEICLTVTDNPYGVFGNNEPHILSFDSWEEFQEYHEKWRNFVPVIKTREDGTVIVHSAKTFTKNDILEMFPKSDMDKTIKYVTATYGDTDMAKEKANSFGVGYQMAWDNIMKKLNEL